MLNAYETWKSEQAAIDAEMDALLSGELIISPADRQVRAVRFMALIERRESAARALLQSDQSHPLRRWEGRLGH